MRSRQPHPPPRAEIVALVLALPPALTGPFFFGAAHWWSAGLLAASAFAALTLLLLARGSRPVSGPLPTGFSAWCIWTLWLAVRMAVNPPVPRAALLSFLEAASCLSAGVVVAAVTASSSRIWRAATLAFVVSLCAQAGFGIVQWITQNPLIYSTPRLADYAHRTSGTFLNPNDSALFLVLGLCAALALALDRSARFSVRLLSGAAALLCLPGIVTSLSRAGVLALAAAMASGGALLFLRTRAWRKVALAMLVPALLAGATWMVWTRIPEFRARWEKLLLRPREQADARSGIWADTTRMILDKPVWGHGTGTFEDAAAAYRHDYHDWWTTLNHAHNEAMQVAADHGLVGAGIALLCATLLFASGVRAFRAEGSGAGRFLPAGWLAMSVAALVHSLFDCSLRRFAISHAFMLVSALFGAARARSTGRSPGSRSPAPPRPLPGRLRSGLGAAAALACGLACLATWRGAVLERRATESVRRNGYLSERVEPLLRAGLRIDPLNFFFPLELSKQARARIPFASIREKRVALLEEAENWLAHANRLRPNHLEILNWKVDHLLLRGEYESALALARKIAVAYPSHIDALTRVGVILMRLENHGEAREVFRKAWDLHHGLAPTPEARYWYEQIPRIQKERQKKAAPPSAPPPPI